MITEKLPSDWRDLQQLVATVLAECGFSVEVERPTRTVRGTKEVDVYAEELHRGRKSIVLCECKHWNVRVPQDVVHSFLTIVGGTGANVGYIVGSSGFQSGALESAELTNIRLVTWQEFQREFEHQWIEEHLVPRVGDRYKQFLRWTEPLPPTGGPPLTSHQAEAFSELWRSYQPLASLITPFEPWRRTTERDLVYPRLPLTPENWHGLPKDLVESRGYRELFERLDSHTAAAVAALRAAALAG